MPIVTVSRRVGAFGDVIAAVVAKKLGLNLVTRQQLHELAQTCDPAYKDACQAYETEHSPSFFERIFFDTPAHVSLFEALTFEEAGKGGVVLVGRGAQIVLRNVPGVLKVRVVAPTNIRVERIMERYALSKREAEDFVRKHDHDRTTLIRLIFDRDPTDWALYDLIVNTEQFIAADASELVADAAVRLKEAADRELTLAALKRMALAKRVETIIRRKMSSAVARNVVVTSDADGSLLLTGRIRSKREKDQAEQIAREYEGVVNVDNDLKVTELSFGL